MTWNKKLLLTYIQKLQLQQRLFLQTVQWKHQESGWEEGEESGFWWEWGLGQAPRLKKFYMFRGGKILNTGPELWGAAALVLHRERKTSEMIRAGPKPPACSETSKNTTSRKMLLLLHSVWSIFSRNDETAKKPDRRSKCERLKQNQRNTEADGFPGQRHLSKY